MVVLYSKELAAGVVWWDRESKVSGYVECGEDNGDSQNRTC